MYSIFLAIISKLGISPRLAFDLLYITACLVFLCSLRMLVCNRIALLFGFSILILNPITYSHYWAFAIRQELYLPNTLVFISSIFIIGLSILQNRGNSLLVWFLVCGCTLAVGWNTREESIWMIIALLPAICLGIYQIWVERRISTLIGLFCLVAVPWITWHIFASENEEHYGYYGTVDVKAPEFSRAFNAILSLNVNDNRPMAYLTFETRDKMLEISDSTKELIGVLLNEDGVYRKHGRAIFGGIASWNIRGAMRHLGYYKNFNETEAHYKIIADDIKNYCNNNKSNCRQPLLSGFPFKNGTVSRIPKTAKNKFIELVRFSNYAPPEAGLPKQNGDRAFSYTVAQFFNINTQENAEFDARLSDIEAVALRKLKNMNNHFEFYYNYFYWLFFAAIVLSLVAILLQWEISFHAIGLFSLWCLGITFSMNVIVALTAVPSVARPLMTCSIPMLCFTAYILSGSIEKLLTIPKLMANK